jgi:hypothetical protein
VQGAGIAQRVWGEWRYSSLSLGLGNMKVSGHLHAPASLLPGKAVGTHWIGGWAGRRTNMNAVEKDRISCGPRETVGKWSPMPFNENAKKENGLSQDISFCVTPGAVGSWTILIPHHTHFNLVDGGVMLIRNICIRLYDYAVSQLDVTHGLKNLNLHNL